MKRLLVVLTLVPAVAAGGAWWWARSSLPIIDGRLALPELRAPVEVLFEAHGVPAVDARGPDVIGVTIPGGRQHLRRLDRRD